MSLYQFLKGTSFGLFNFGQRLGLFITPAHYYVPLASTRALKATEDHWNKPIDTAFLPLDIEAQRAFLADNIRPFEPEYRGNAVYSKAVEELAGPGYGYIEAQALHGFLRWLKPARIVEVGSGTSTICALYATKLNAREGFPCALTCIEPYPSDALRRRNVTLLERKVEDVDIAAFDQLEAGDFLFIDSSHAFRPCGDVQRIYLEVLPRLKRGVYVHIHDIYIPYAFQPDVETTYMQWMETALLIAMLNHSRRYEVVFCESLLFHAAPDALKAAFPEFEMKTHRGGLIKDTVETRHFPSAIFLRVG